MDVKAIIKEFSAKTGTPGLESEAAAYGASLLSAYGPVEHTPLGSLICRVKAPGPGRPHLMLEAHMDEIGMVVTYIEDSGFLRVAACGGVDKRLLLASRVTVHTAGGDLNGVVCSIPPHLNKDGDDKNKKVDEIYIDIGYDGEAAKAKVLPGDRITFHAFSRELAGGRVSGKALDDRAGCVSLLCALEALGGDLPDCGLTVVFASMEEVGGQGAKTAAYAVAPTHAAAVDVSFAHTHDAPKEKCGLMGKGPMIGYAPILDRELSGRLAQLAEDAGIPYQREVMGGRTGTDADQIATVRGGVRTALVSIPLKYMHMPIEMIDPQDVENTGKLLAQLAREIGGAK